MLGKENNFSQTKSPKLQKAKSNRQEEQNTPKLIAKRIKSVLGLVNPTAKSTSNDTSNPQPSQFNAARTKKPITNPLQEIKQLDDISNRHAPNTFRTSTDSFHNSFKSSRHLPTEEAEPKRESSIYVRTYMLRSGYSTHRPAVDVRSKSKPKTIQIHISELGSAKGKTQKPKKVSKKDPTAKRLFTDVDDLGAEADMFNSNIDDDDTSINSVPASHQIPNTSRSRTYLLDSDRQNITWAGTDDGSFHLSKRNLDDSNKKYRYAEVSCSMSDIGSARRRVEFNDVFIKKNAGREILSTLLSFLNTKDAYALMITSKAMNNETKTFKKHFREIKLNPGLDMGVRKGYWVTATKAKVLKELYGEAYFTSLLIKTSPAESDIKKDIDRTFLHLKLFKNQNGQDSLFRILKALAVHDPEIGYCQGMNFVAATLMMVQPEVDAFFIMLSLIKNYKFKGIYGDNLKGTIQMCEIFDWLLRIYHPDLSEYLENMDIRSIHFFTQWCTGLFSCELDKETVFKIWDLFFQDEWKFIFKLSLAIIKEIKEKLFKMPSENVVSFLRHFSKGNSLDIEKVFKEIPHIKLTNRLLNELWQAVASTKKIKKVSLYFDPKASKKNWRIEYFPDPETQDIVTAIPPKTERCSSKKARTKSSPGFLTTLFEKLKSKLTTDSNPNEFENKSKLDISSVKSTLEFDSKVIDLNEYMPYDQENVSQTPTYRLTPKILNTKNNYLKHVEDGQQRSLLTSRLTRQTNFF